MCEHARSERSQQVSSVDHPERSSAQPDVSQSCRTFNHSHIAANEPLGGDPACWLHLVCSSCGVMLDEALVEHRPDCSEGASSSGIAATL